MLNSSYYIGQIPGMENTFENHGGEVKSQYDAIPRIAVGGRSNCGKSTLINSLLQKKLARVSKTPGKTRNIYFYFFHSIARILVDLPGYGYAATSKTERNSWRSIIEGYFASDLNLRGALILVDSRHGIMPQDQLAITYFLEKNLKTTIVYTKTDLLKNQKNRASTRNFAQQQFEKFGYDQRVNTLWISSRLNEGISNLKRYLKEEF